LLKSYFLVRIPPLLLPVVSEHLGNFETDLSYYSVRYKRWYLLSVALDGKLFSIV